VSEWLVRTARVVAGLAALLAPAAARGVEAKRPPTTSAPADLAKEAKRIAADALKRLGEGYASRIDAKRHIVYVSAVDPKALAHTMKLLGGYSDALRRTIFTRPVRWNVTVVLPTVRDYRRFVPLAKAHGIYHTRSRTLFSISFSNVLIHEFTHALHHNDQAGRNQSHPIWLVEGLATLFQGSELKDGKAVVGVDATLVRLQGALADERAHALGDLLAMDQRQFMAEEELTYAEARYLMLYLHRRGKLSAFYSAYTGGYRADRSGAKALAATLGKPLAEVEKNWRKWVMSLEPPWRPLRQPRAFLGVKMRQADGGVEVAGFLPNSPADRAKRLKVGDVIISLAGQAVRTPRQLTRAVQDAKPGHIVDIEVIRGDRTAVVKQLLGATRP
jgi:hypothetical protein